MSQQVGARIHVTGIVQGVGFRPFVYALAARLSLNGWVRNTSGGVDIEVDGAEHALADFATALRREAPPLAHVEAVSIEQRPYSGFVGFEIVASEPIPGAFQPVSPDVSVCPDCLRELFAPGDRRYHYPFINCTNCGPRFTIIEDIPYDRPNTTMASFELCPECRGEYENPLDRRFHAQPVACPKCGPRVWIELAKSASESPGFDAGSAKGRAGPIEAAVGLLQAGRIVAIKGLGGFHLACDATNTDAVSELRRRKLRVDKPFALMMPDLAAIERHCFLGDSDRELLQSRERPIVILKRRPGSDIAPQVAPRQDTLGVMLPYTPLHYLLLRDDRGPRLGSGLTGPLVLVMTSGNVSEEPIATDNSEARARLENLADAFLMHDRPIRTRCDDSVVRVFQAKSYALRRSRGYAPYPVPLPFDSPAILAGGAELKNVFCLTRDRYAFLSHYIGDLENYETLQSFEDGIEKLSQLFRVRPQLLAYDLHPDYMATRYILARAEREGLTAVGVQHHHAHVAACMVENGLAWNRPVIGVAFDGAGYGTDDATWGGEFLIADLVRFTRAFHLDYVPLPGGDKAVREPWRTALAWLDKGGIGWDTELAPVRASEPDSRGIVRAQIKQGLNAPPTSSMGRLFDAAAALAGVRETVNYEAQAAIEFEALADPTEKGCYPIDLRGGVVDPVPMFGAIVADLRAGTAVSAISSRVHNGVAHMVLDVCRSLRASAGLNEIALSGGVWQNMTLLSASVGILRADGFAVYTHRFVPPNDGGIALGQAAVAAGQFVAG